MTDPNGLPEWHAPDRPYYGAWRAHPAADLFPLIDGPEFADLVESIRVGGLNEPIWLYDDPELGVTLLDGRNRHRACTAAGVEPTTRTYSGDDPIRFVIDENLKRRHLNSGQVAFVMLAAEAMYAERVELRRIAAIAAAAATRERDESGRLLPTQTTADLRPSGPATRPPSGADLAALAAGKLPGRKGPTSGRAISQAKRIATRAETDPEAAELLAGVKAGTIALDRAEKTIVRKDRQAEKATAVALIEATPADDLDQLGTYDVLYVDPPWRYEHAPDDTRAVENHYPTMTLDALKALRPPAGDDAVLLMWATSPKLAEALDLMAAWEFDYRTSMVWVKDRIGMGYYARQRHELLLIGKRGDARSPDEEDRPDSVIEAPRGAHSAKPPIVYDLIDRMFAGRTKVELFARTRRPGWAAWGNQA